MFQFLYVGVFMTYDHDIPNLTARDFRSSIAVRNFSWNWPSK